MDYVEKIVKSKKPLNYMTGSDEDYEFGFWESENHTYGIVLKKKGWLNLIQLERNYDGEIYEDENFDMINDIEEEIQKQLLDDAKEQYEKFYETD